ncbi:L-glutamate gamma-semialdehyde dehydrogenase [Burkholderia sp. Ac-20344]|uniref:L-glutamate gamma-semialdehyde dehydrogenase n=1 Tax=Burkholderia sp. Ac-20344 TaxID=2703890 RepID=UPI00197CB1FD|nr:L-glutamate gamma-semialdehyde dehydrogenase [Burkholderia sp. Ac-20344]MBN3835986.1 L-glutamate gamma-semialdehyde dehydrogenase [Burkholderia sp. Ac-20344]
MNFDAVNETVLNYTRGSAERMALEAELARQSAETIDIPVVAGGKKLYCEDAATVTQPHNHSKVLARLSHASSAQLATAVDAAQVAHRDWSNWSFEDRAHVFLRAADLLAGPWRQRLNAATMLGQSKTCFQAEIDSACELIDFLRFNVAFAEQVYANQPISPVGVRNSIEYRPLEGFVYAVTPFNFTAIGGNLATAPAIMGNTVIWKPAATASLSNYLFMQLLEEAGLPPGVINFVPGSPTAISNTLLAHPDFAGLHFTGSTAVLDSLWLESAKNLSTYRSYPRLVGETGGKDFILAHASADIAELSTALLRGAFEYQGQKCSAASRAYIPASLWPGVKDHLLSAIETIGMGDVEDFSNFMGAVIDRRAFDRIQKHIEQAKNSSNATVLCGGKCDDSVGYFIEPTVIEVNDPSYVTMREELFGPVLSVYVYDDSKWQDVLQRVDGTSGYGLTGSIFARDRKAVHEARSSLRYAAGNFYINDKPTGAVVGQQPFGGARRSGTNDKAGSYLNLLRWTSPRTIKETSVAAKSYKYPYMA